MNDLIGKRIPVLDRGFAELQEVMGSDRTMVSAARTSFLNDSKGDIADKKLLFRLMKDRHTSPMEMAEMRIRVHAPVVVFWQWTRHRLFNFNLSSGRYIEFDENEFYIPDVWRLQSSSNKQASEGVLNESDSIMLTELLEKRVAEDYELYRLALSKGVAREQARLFLPGFAVYYTAVVKCDVHNWLNFFRLRMAADAQQEIREYATAIYTEFFKPCFAWTAEAFEQYVLKAGDNEKTA